MYNPEQKKEYLAFLISKNTSASDLDFVEDLFDSVGKAETAVGSDLSVMTAEQAGTFISQKRSCLDTSHFRSIWWLYCYVKWCAASGNGSVGEWTNAIRRARDMENARMQMVSNDFDLQMRLDQMLTDEKKMTLDNLVRACAWLLFAGVDIEKVCQVKRTDVDIRSMTVKVDDTWYDISEYGRNSVRFSAEDELYTRHFLHTARTRGMFLNEDRTLRKNTDSDMLFRDSAGPIDLDAMMYIYNRRATAFYGKNTAIRRRLSLRSISMSGIFDRMYKMEMAGYDPIAVADVEQYMRLAREDSVHLNPNYNGRARKISDKDRLRESYYKWRLAFLPQIKYNN